VRATAKNLLALDVERKVVLHPLFVVPPDVPKHVPRPRRERGGSIPRPSVVPNVYTIREPVLVPDRIVAFLRAHLPRLAGLDIAGFSSGWSSINITHTYLPSAVGLARPANQHWRCLAPELTLFQRLQVQLIDSALPAIVQGIVGHADAAAGAS
jgi:hypothetical protein